MSVGINESVSQARVEAKLLKNGNLNKNRLERIRKIEEGEKILAIFLVCYGTEPEKPWNGKHFYNLPFFRYLTKPNFCAFVRIIYSLQFFFISYVEQPTPPLLHVVCAIFSAVREKTWINV